MRLAGRDDDDVNNPPSAPFRDRCAKESRLASVSGLTKLLVSASFFLYVENLVDDDDDGSFS